MSDTYLQQVLQCDKPITCAKCGEAFAAGFNYCPFCGTENSEEQALDESITRPQINRADDVNQILTSLRGLRVRLWEYGVSHCLLHLRVSHPRTETGGDDFNTLIVCNYTEHIQIGVWAWDNALILRTCSENPKLYELIDEKAGVKIICRGVFFYQNMPAQFYGS